MTERTAMSVKWLAAIGLSIGLYACLLLGMTTFSDQITAAIAQKDTTDAE